MRLLWVLLVALLLAPAMAGMVLQPVDGSGNRLQPNRLTARVNVQGQFAETRMTWEFANNTGGRIEADFLYTLPEGAVPTYFAYWFGEEKVVARVVEKERAAAIYQHITARQRDPALIELTGENVLRARIFPVMPDSDLRVEIHLVQALANEQGRPVYTFPLLDDAQKITFDTLDLTVDVRAMPNLQRVETNYGLPVTQTADGYQARLRGEHYRPEKDLRVTQSYPPTPLHASLYAARSGGPDGFFALSLTPDHSINGLHIAVTGIATYDTVQLSTSTAAGKVVFLYGRYRGSGDATVTLSGTTPDGPRVYTAALAFPATAEPNNPATKLWAWERMKRLSSRKDAIAMSLRYGMPSRFTSWLAVPVSEMQRYRREKAEEQMYSLAKQLAQLISDNRGETRTAHALRARLTALGGQWKVDTHQILLYCLRDKMYMLGDNLAGMIAHGRDQTRLGRQARARLIRLGRHLGISPDEYVRQSLYWYVDNLAEALVAATHGSYPAPPDAAQARRLRQRLHHIAAAIGGDRTKNRAFIDGRISYYELPWVRGQFIAEMNKETPDAGRLRRLRERFIVFNTAVMERDYALMRTERLEVRARLARIERRIAAASEPELTELNATRMQLVQREEALRVRMGDPLITVDAPADALRVIAILPDGEIKEMIWNAARGRWEARFDVPGYASSGDYTITILVVRKDGTRSQLAFRYTVDVTPPTATGTATMVAQPAPVLRLELQASADTARVTAVLPWGERRELSTAGDGRFFALAPLPAEQTATPLAVTYILTDKAHNRTTLTVQPTTREVAQ